MEYRLSQEPQSWHLGILRGSYFIGLPLDSIRNPFTLVVDKIAQLRVHGMLHVVIAIREWKDDVISASFSIKTILD